MSARWVIGLLMILVPFAAAAWTVAGANRERAVVEPREATAAQAPEEPARWCFVSEELAPSDEPPPWLIEGPIAVGNRVRVRVERLFSDDPTQPTVFMFWTDGDACRLTIKNGQATLERWDDLSGARAGACEEGQ